MSQERPTDPLLRIASYLDELGLDYAVTGSVAGSFYGLRRSTLDIDIVLSLPESAIPLIVRSLQEAYFIDEVMVADAVRRKVMFNVIPKGKGSKVDLAVLSDDSFEQSVLSRRRQIQWKGTPVWVVSAEDLVISKLRWVQISWSDRQLEDVRAIMDGGNASDDEYIDEWIRRLSLENFLDAARTAGHDDRSGPTG